ncbi:hypothetical protein V1520DRAFT_329290 [Lipomyces starkeyi]|uniref:Uncharacterized protein n=1 Tax=Lipomyces starkeyi NRRL Y-11557 TaxID=675824 RepID=A0A1E3Q722_LIPST|nr:hypothetical protein LIPSTDRAFT_62678 [Lipomyces starkeyi NRRL Y-11557]
MSQLICSSENASRGITEVLGSDSLATEFDSDDGNHATERQSLEEAYAQDLKLGRTRSTETWASAYGVNEVEAPVDLGPDDNPGTLERQMSHASAQRVLEQQGQKAGDSRTLLPWPLAHDTKSCMCCGILDGLEKFLRRR